MSDKSNFFQWIIPTKGLAPYYDAFVNLINEIDKSLFDVKNSGTALKLTTWTTATRPTNPDPGTIGFNSENAQVEVWDSQDWRIL